jgi:hypothetical protein
VTVETIRTPIALEARDLLPATWEALAEDDGVFGPAALERRHNRITRKIFGSLLSQEEQEAMEDVDGRLIEYAGKMLAYSLLDPAIDYWGKQKISFGVWDRETATYGDRIKELQELKLKWPADLSELLGQIEDLLTARPGRATSSPHVIQAGENVPHVTPNPLEITAPWGPYTPGIPGVQR